MVISHFVPKRNHSPHRHLPSRCSVSKNQQLRSPMTNEKQQLSIESVRPRFSLLTALLVTSFVGMAIVIVQFWREIGPLRDEVRQLRTEVGRLTIDDPSKIQGIEVPTPSDRTWIWRIWIPPGQSIFIGCAVGDVPKDGEPPHGRTVPLDPGENLVSLTFFRDEDDPRWKYRFGQPTATFPGIVPEGQDWLNWTEFQQHGRISFGPKPSTLPDFPTKHVIVRKRMSRLGGPNPFDASEPLPGFIVWLERH
jgi:hypothetical protein